MGRHSTPDDADDQTSAEDVAQAQVAESSTVTQTGRHNRAELASLTLAEDAPVRGYAAATAGGGGHGGSAPSSGRDSARAFTVPYGRSPYAADVTADAALAPGRSTSGSMAASGSVAASGYGSMTAAATAPWLDRAVPTTAGAVLTEEQTRPGEVVVTPSRAGRNLPAAIVVSLGLGALIVASLLIYRPSFIVIICLAMSYGIYEMVRAIGAAEARPPLVPLVVGGLAMDIAAWFHGANGLVLGLLLTVLGVSVWRLAEGAVGYARDVTSAAFIALYVPTLGGFAVLLTHYSDGAGRVIAFIATVVCSDVGGYTAGVLFGKHPMAPTVSPKKSWEGFVGSAVACSIGGGLFMSLLFHHRWWLGVLYGLAIAVTATLGDLGESMVKRDLGVKDMGRLLPGHGGLMDRLDSLLPCAAVAYLILSAALA